MTTTPVEPAIRPPTQPIGKVVIIALRHREPIENDLGLAVGNIVLVRIGNEQQLGRTHQPDTTPPHLDTGQHLDLVGENLSGIGFPVAILIMKNENSIAQGEVETLCPLRVGVVLRNPHAAFPVPRHRDRVSHLRLCRKEIDRKSLGKIPHRQRLLRRWRIEGGVFLAVVNFGKLGTEERWSEGRCEKTRVENRNPKIGEREQFHDRPECSR